MIKNIYLLIFLNSFIIIQQCHSQSKPALQFSAGLAFPGKEFEGELVTVDESGISSISSDFIKNNYAVSTGASITGTLKFPFEHTGIVSGLFTGSYVFFNAFRRSILGVTELNNIEVPVSFDNRFSSSTFALGAEVSPSPGSRISPFVNANLSLNILSLSLSKDDETSVIFNDAFRMGLLANAGIDFKIDQEYSVLFSGSYHMSNLFFKSGGSSYSDRVEFYTDANSINDKEGTFYSNLSNPDNAPVLVSGGTKNVNWWGINLGLSIVLGKSKK